MRFSPLWMVGAEMIPEPIWALGNVWPKLPIKFSLPSSCLCLAATVLKLVLSQNLKGMHILGLNLSLFPLSFCTPCSLILCAANSICFSLTWLCSLSPHLCKRPSGYLVFSSLPSRNFVQEESWGDYRAPLICFPSLRDHIPAFPVAQYFKSFFHVYSSVV